MARVWRLRPGGEFGRVRQNGRAWPHRFFVSHRASPPRSAGAPPRIGVAAGKRLGNAVLRNRLKRRLREGVRQVYPNLISGIDVVIICAPRAHHRSQRGAKVVCSSSVKMLQQAKVVATLARQLKMG